MKIINLVEKILEYWLWVLILIGLIYFTVLVVKSIYRFIKKRLKQETMEELREENERLKQTILDLSGKVTRLEGQISPKDSGYTFSNSQLINVGTIKIKSDEILYVVSQSYEQVTSGNSRIKVIHYINSAKTDSVYSTFESILEQLTGNFMMINKNQLVNLREIQKIQGNNLYLKNVKEPFIISEVKKEELDIRIANL